MSDSTEKKANTAAQKLGAAHTPGPWRLSNINDGGHLGAEVEIDSDHHIGLATVVWRMENEGRSTRLEANARLIAAAPELLEALEEIIETQNLLDSDAAEVLAEYEGVSCMREAVSRSRAVLKAYAAVKKARGE